MEQGRACGQRGKQAACVAPGQVATSNEQRVEVCGTQSRHARMRACTVPACAVPCLHMQQHRAFMYSTVPAHVVHCLHVRYHACTRGTCAVPCLRMWYTMPACAVPCLHVWRWHPAHGQASGLWPGGPYVQASRACNGRKGYVDSKGIEALAPAAAPWVPAVVMVGALCCGQHGDY